MALVCHIPKYFMKKIITEKKGKETENSTPHTGIQHRAYWGMIASSTSEPCSDGGQLMVQKLRDGIRNPLWRDKLFGKKER